MLSPAAAQVMTMIAARRPLAEVLAAVVQGVETAHPSRLCSILLLSDDRLFLGAAPSLPVTYNAAIDGTAVGPDVGSCGSAVFLGRRIIVADIETDPRWSDFKHLALEAKLRSCWSEPVRDADGHILGAFAMYGRAPGSPDSAEIETIVQAAHLAAIAIQCARSDETLTASEANAQRARQEAEAHSHRLHVALKVASAAVVEVDYEHETVWSSPRFAEICGRDLTYMEARLAVWPFVHPQDGSAIEVAVNNWLQGAAPEALEARVRLADGREKWVSIYTEIIKGADGRWRKTIALILDIDERKRQELALIDAERAALAAAETKSLFLANMSHEIRTPLNGVLAMAQLISCGALDPGQRDKLDIVLQSGRTLLHLINDILDFSKIDAGKLELERAVFDLDSVIRSAVATFMELADQKGVQLTLSIAPGAQGLRKGDAARLRQILSNFISNALKFTSHGRVTVQVRGEGEGGRDGLTLSVHDTGVGIAPEKMPLLFQRFSQIDASTTRQYGGTGLGLAICGELAQMMGGRAWAESTLGEGSTFHATLALPWCGDPGAAIAPTLEPQLRLGDGGRPPRRVLAAEDNLTNQLVLRATMPLFGLDLTIVSNGREAVETWRGGHFDLILMDVQMPVMDGCEATRAIRAEERAKGLRKTPIIALSANAFQHQVEEYLAAGMDGHIAKPIELANAQETLQRVLMRSEEPDALSLAAD